MFSKTNNEVVRIEKRQRTRTERSEGNDYRNCACGSGTLRNGRRDAIYRVLISISRNAREHERSEVRAINLINI